MLCGKRARLRRARTTPGGEKMARYSTGRTLGINANQMQAMRLLAEGKDEKFIRLILWGDAATDEEEAAHSFRYTKRLRAWLRDPKCQEAYRAVVREIAMPTYGKAMGVMVRQLDSGNEWVAQGAAREVLTRFGPAVLGDDDREITVRIEGMPVLGAPLPGDGLPDDTGL